MLMARSLVELLQSWSDGSLPELDNELLRDKVVPTLFQCLAQILRSQLVDGSWGIRGPREETAYTIITLTNLRILPLAQFFRAEIISAIDRGRSFLRNTSGHRPEYLWIEKVTYWSENLAEAYTVAALYAAIDKPSLGSTVWQLSGISSQDLAEFGLRTESGPLSKDPKWLVIASWIDGRLCIPRLQRRLGDLWHREELMRRYEGMAFRWIFANNRTSSVVSSQFLCDMISLSLLNDRIIASVDEAISSQKSNRIAQLKDSLCEAVEHSRQKDCAISELGLNGAVSKIGEEENLQPAKRLGGKDHHVLHDIKSLEFHKASDVLVTPSSFVDWFERHDGLSGAGESDKETLRLEVERFFLAQISRMEDQRSHDESSRHQCAAQCDSGFVVAGSKDRSLTWSRSASLTGLPHIFAFAICLKSRNGNDSFPTASQKYIAEEARHGVATVYRLQQDITKSRCSSSTFGLGLREQFTAILSYEKAQLGVTMAHLANTGLDIDVLKTVTIVAEVADLAGKLYDLGL